MFLDMQYILMGRLLQNYPGLWQSGASDSYDQHCENLQQSLVDSSPVLVMWNNKNTTWQLVEISGMNYLSQYNIQNYREI